MPLVPLAHGATHYELAGPEHGPLVVLLHGGTIPMWVWDRQVPALVGAGLRVLRYDMLGRGGSAYPHARYDRELYLTQLLELFDAVGSTAPVDLVGFSFGGATAAHFTVRHPHRVRRLALVAPTVRFASNARVLRLVRLPWIGPRLMRSVVLPRMVERASHLWGDGNHAERYAELFRRQVEHEAFAPAALSFMRSDALRDYRETFRALGRTRRPTLLIRGSEDGDFPAADAAFLREVVPHVQYEELEGVGHGAPLRAPDRVNELLLRFLA